jgi:hypothetical protein
MAGRQTVDAGGEPDGVAFELEGDDGGGGESKKR